MYAHRPRARRVSSCEVSAICMYGLGWPHAPPIGYMYQTGTYTALARCAVARAQLVGDTHV